MDQYFYSTQIYDDFLILPEDEAHHALKVLRKKAGDEIIVVDGNGGLYEALFENENARNCNLKIINSKKILDVLITIFILVFLLQKVMIDLSGLLKNLLK